MNANQQCSKLGPSPHIASCKVYEKWFAFTQLAYTKTGLAYPILMPKIAANL